ncbi:MAG: von Willebrand factor, type [Acidobacteriaceae bacterium]|jgi:Ca-activated chloride channel family protein|nr:von Willebrand factor, type [Acidobacteriaceae bacterium]
MKLCNILLLLSSLGLFLAAAPGQDSKQELPSAPSASKQDQNKPAPTPSDTPSNSPKTEPPASTQTPPAATSTSGEESKSSSSPTQGSQSDPAQAGASQSGEQQPPGSEEDKPTTIRRTVNEVNVVFTVTDRHGHYVKDLRRDDFRVIDDNKPASEIRSFNRETNLPLEVGLLIDASNSVRDRFKFEQESAVEFLNQTIRPRYDKAFVVGFDVTPEVTQDFTDNTEALSIGVRALRPGGGTALYDALYFACRDKLLKTEHNTPTRRAIVLLTDGEDNQSHVTREEAIDMAQRAEVIVYTISTNISGSPGHGDKVLERIADATGGRAFFPFQLTDVASAFVQIQDELRSQYALSYKPADLLADGRYHTIEIMAQNHKGLRVRSRRGYFAPNQ